MPKLAKSTKIARDEGVIRGARKHWSGEATLVINDTHYTLDSLVAVFEDHLRAMARVSDLTILRRLAVAEERKLEARAAELFVGVKSMVASRAGGRHAAGLREFGIKPDKKPRMTAETKKRANEKRQETRKRLGVLGKKQRARLKRGR